MEIFKTEDGTLDRTIDHKRRLKHLTVIDDNTVVWSYDDHCLAVFDLNTEDVKKEIEVVTKGLVNEIAYEDGLLYNVIFGERISQNSNDEEQRIIVIDLSGNQIRNFFVSSNRHGKTSIATDSNSIFSISRHNVVFCYDLKGVLKWTFEDDKPCYLTAIASYEDGQLFVVIKSNIFLLSADGKSLDVVLECSKEISGIYYEKTLKLLMLYDKNNVFLYRVNH